MKNWFYPFTMLLFSCICFGCIYHEFNVAYKVSNIQQQYVVQTDSIVAKYNEVQEQLNKIQYAFEQQNQQSRKDTLVVRMNKLVIEHTSKR